MLLFQNTCWLQNSNFLYSMSCLSSFNMLIVTYHFIEKHRLLERHWDLVSIIVKKFYCLFLSVIPVIKAVLFFFFFLKILQHNSLQYGSCGYSRFWYQIYSFYKLLAIKYHNFKRTFGKAIYHSFKKKWSRNFLCNISSNMICQHLKLHSIEGHLKSIPYFKLKPRL